MKASDFQRGSEAKQHEFRRLQEQCKPDHAPTRKEAERIREAAHEHARYTDKVNQRPSARVRGR